MARFRARYERYASVSGTLFPMPRSSWSPLLASAIALTGCYASAAAPVPDPDPGPVVGDLACPPSELALAWAREDGTAAFFHPVSLDVAPGDALFLVRSDFGSAAVRARDGEHVVIARGGPLDAAWSRSVEVDPGTREVRVRAVATGEVLATLAAAPAGEGFYGTTRATLTDDGARALVLECDRSGAGDASRTLLRELTIATGAEVRVELPLACSASWSSPSAIVPLPGERAAIVASLRAPGPEWTDEGAAPARSIARVDFASGAVVIAEPISDVLAEVHGRPAIGGISFDVLAVAAGGDARALALVGRDGLLRRLDARTLAPIAEPIEVAIHVANPDSYLPSLESPLALSVGGALLAHVDAEGAIVVRDAATGAIGARLEMPFDREAPRSLGPPALMALRFVDDGLIVAGSSGTARFACGGEIAELVRPPGELVLRVEAPSVVRTGEPARFAIDVEAPGGALPVVRAVRMGAAGGLYGTLGREVEAYPADTGVITIEAIADDGVRRASATLEVEVVPGS